MSLLPPKILHVPLVILLFYNKLASVAYSSIGHDLLLDTVFGRESKSKFFLETFQWLLISRVRTAVGLSDLFTSYLKSKQPIQLSLFAHSLSNQWYSILFLTYIRRVRIALSDHLCWRCSILHHHPALSFLRALTYCWFCVYVWILSVSASRVQAFWGQGLGLSYSWLHLQHIIGRWRKLQSLRQVLFFNF